jgi:two-component system phosphate regulon response regulator PhoB
MTSSQRPQPLILVVDDDQVVLSEVTAALTASGFACRCCSTSDAAVAEAESLLPDLILSDAVLSGTSGLEMCRRIQQNPELAEVPVMFLSASQIPDIIHRSNGVHGTYFLRKPPDPGVLVELIDRALRRSRPAVPLPVAAVLLHPLTLPLAAQ